MIAQLGGSMRPETGEPYRTLLDTSPEPILVHRQNRFLYANPAALRLFAARSFEELAAHDFLDLLHPLDRGCFASRLRADPSDARPARREARIQRLTGDEAQVEITCSAIEYRGAPAMELVLRDISERTRREAELSAAQRRSAAILESISDGFISVDREWRYQYVNSAAGTLMRTPPGYLLGKTVWDAWPDAQKMRFAREFRRAVDENVSLQFEEFYPAIHAWFEVRCYPSSEGLTVFFSDVTERQQARTALERDKEELEERVRQRTMELQAATQHLEQVVRQRTHELESTNQRLRMEITTRRRLETELLQRNLELAEEGRRKDKFLAMLGHELRNPLAPIRNAVHLLRHLGPQTSAMQQARAMIDRQVTHMARLVDDLLDVSRITEGKIVLRKTRLDLVTLVQPVAEDHRSLLESVGLSFQVQLPTHPIWVSADSARVSQIVGNLLHNAAKFTDPDGQVLLEVGTDAEAGAAVIRVRDTGIGIESDLLRRIFQPFCQSEQSVERSRGGLGLGLALVDGLAQLHGGSVQAASAGPGCGAEFVVRLPLEEAPAEDTAETTSDTLPRSRRVLIIEDNIDTATSLHMLLELLGHEVDEAHTATAGLERARAFHPEVILCDIGLPGEIDGYGFARTARKDPVLRDVYLVALTGYGTDEDRRRASEAGFQLHLTKPADPQVLETLLAGEFPH